MTRPLELTITKTIPAAVETVFDAWLDAKALARFIKPMAGMPDCEVENDPRVGGSFRIVMMAGDKALPHTGEYKVIERHERIVFTWLSDNAAPDSTVTLRFARRGPSETELTLHHVGFPGQQSRDNHEGGWGAIVEQLARNVG